MREIVFATNNPHKLEEARAIAAGRLRILSLADIGCREELPETCDTLEGNAMQKASYVRDRYAADCFADDTGLLVEALGGAPGVMTARFAGEHCSPDDNIDLLLRRLEGVADRRARFATVVALARADGGGFVCRGEVEGSIATERQGDAGFGYDPVFIPVETGVSFARMEASAKNAVSHRGRAMRAFMRRLLPADNSETT